MSKIDELSCHTYSSHAGCEDDGLLAFPNWYIFPNVPFYSNRSAILVYNALDEYGLDKFSEKRGMLSAVTEYRR